jgi:hypothetical protein
MMRHTDLANGRDGLKPECTKQLAELFCRLAGLEGELDFATGFRLCVELGALVRDEAPLANAANAKRLVRVGEVAARVRVVLIDLRDRFARKPAESLQGRGQSVERIDSELEFDFEQVAVYGLATNSCGETWKNSANFTLLAALMLRAPLAMLVIVWRGSPVARASRHIRIHKRNDKSSSRKLSLQDGVAAFASIQSRIKYNMFNTQYRRSR